MGVAFFMVTVCLVIGGGLAGSVVAVSERDRARNRPARRAVAPPAEARLERMPPPAQDVALPTREPRLVAREVTHERTVTRELYQ